MADLLVFDWNGTVLADTAVVVAACNVQIEYAGGTPLGGEEMIKRFNFPIAEFLLELGCDPEKLTDSGFADVFHDSYQSLAGKCRTRRGVREVLDYAQGNKVDSMILSNHLEHEIRGQLDRLNLTSYFSRVLAHQTNQDCSAGNTKIAWMERYFTESGVDPARSLIVGDSPEDIGIGKTLGMETVAITDGYYPISKLKDAEPDHLITNMGDLVQILGR
jgi:phosphoglycolate phosphatase